MTPSETDSPENHSADKDCSDNDSLGNASLGNDSVSSSCSENHSSYNHYPYNYTSDNYSRRLEALIASPPIPDSQLRQLLSSTLNISYFELARRKSLSQLSFTESQAKTLIRSIERLRDNPQLPVQYVTGITYFAGLELQVGPGVFIPRPETELMLELLPIAPQPPHGQRLLDLGAGSGALGLAFKQRYPELAVDLVEKSRPALKYLRQNVNAYNQQLTQTAALSQTASSLGPIARQSTVSPVRVYHLDMLNLWPLNNSAASVAPTDTPQLRTDTPAPRLGTPKLRTDTPTLRLGTSRLRLGYNCIGYDYIVSNPPYVPDTEQISGPAASDPRNALFAGNTGLDLISKIITGAPNLLKPQGLLLLEHHASQRSTLIKLFQQSRWRTLRCFNDLNGLPRFMLAQRAEKSAN